VSTADGAAFAERQGALFVEASAKTAVGVAAAFTDVVGRILDTPALWADAAGASGGTGVGAGAVAKAKAAKEMPGNITLDARDEEWEERPGGCNC
jgi:Ras-related protein Rab-18